MYYKEPFLQFVFHDVNFKLIHDIGRHASAADKAVYTLYIVTNQNNDDVKLRSMRQLAKKYLKSDCKFTPRGGDSMYRFGGTLEINKGTSQEARATFLAALAVNAKYIDRK